MVYPPATERFGGEYADAYDIGGDNQIPGLASARIDLDQNISDLAAETAARAAADTTLQTNITAEATTRAAADTTINGNITTLFGVTNRVQWAILAAGQQLTSNSTTFQNVTGIKLTGAANKTYRFSMSLGLLSTVTADAKYQFTVPAGATLFFSTGNYTDAGGTTSPIGSAGAASTFTVAGTGGNVFIEISGVVAFGGTPGDMQLQAAQNTATVETTDFVVQGTNLWGFQLN